MTSIEQDDLFNVPDDDMMEDIQDDNDENMDNIDMNLDMNLDMEDNEDDNDNEDENEDENENENENDNEEENENDENDENEEENENENEDDNENEDENENEDDQKTTPHEYDPSSLTFREQAIKKAREASGFDIVPCAAIPYSGQCHAFAFTDGPKWILTGGEDGFIRKYDFISSIQGKSPLTMAQKHNLVDSVTKAGVIVSYWENEEPVSEEQLMKDNPKIKPGDFMSGTATYEPKTSPVYSLAAQKDGLWCLSGLKSGGISLYTMRYNEGAIHHYFKDAKLSPDGHADTVSVLTLNRSQESFLSGSWDKTIRMWDLHTGKVSHFFDKCTGQISSIEYRPQGLTDLVYSDDTENDSDVDSLFGESDDEKNREQPDKSSAPQPTSKSLPNEQVFMSSSIDGAVCVWDVRVASPVIKYGISEGVPPWCMSSTWGKDGNMIYVGRRNSIVEEFSVRMPHKQSKNHVKVPNATKTLTFPKISGPVSALSTMPNKDFLLCGSNDNIRLYDLNLYQETASSRPVSKKQATPFLIIPGHQGGILSALHVDETGRFMTSASGNRGWGQSAFTDSVLIYEIDIEGEKEKE